MSPNQFVAAIGLQDEYAPVVAALAHQPLEHYLPIKDEQGHTHISVPQESFLRLPIEQQLLHALFLVPKATRNDWRRHRDDLESDGVTKLWRLLNANHPTANVEAYLFTLSLPKTQSGKLGKTKRSDFGEEAWTKQMTACHEKSRQPVPTENRTQEAG